MLKEIGSNFWFSPEDISKETTPLTPAVFGCMGSDYVWMSSGRSASAFVLDKLGKDNPNLNKVAILPPFTCHTVIDPFLKRGYEIYTYHIGRDLLSSAEDIIKAVTFHQAGIALFHRYFGADTIKSIDYVCHYLRKIGVVSIEDCTQILYSSFKKSNSDYYVSSIRKWCGVPDGGFAVCKEGCFYDKPQIMDKSLQEAKKKASIHKFEYIFNDNGDKTTFLKEYREAEDILDSQGDYYRIADLSVSIQSALNVHELKQKRINNYKIVAAGLSEIKGIRLIHPFLQEGEVPLYCPILCEDRQSVQQILAKNNVYAPIVWPKADCCPAVDEDASYLYDHILCIPIDQRYGEEDMQRILSIIR